MYNHDTPVLVGAGATVDFRGIRISGFLCTTSGTITISKNDGDGTFTTLVNALAVTAGDWVDIPIFVGPNGGRIVSAAAVGVLTTS